MPAVRQPGCTAPHLPVAFALAASITQASVREDMLLAYAFGWAENMVQAAVKSVPLGQKRRPAHPGAPGREPSPRRQTTPCRLMDE
jgi:urease accessory protein UreF